MTKMLLMAGAAIVLSACGGKNDAAEEVEAVMSKLTVDTEQSSLAWKGMKTADYFHQGSVTFADGSVQFIDGMLMSGKFNVDMTSIAVTDELPEDKKGMLIGHLSSADFFDVATNAKVKVTCGAVTDGLLPVTINISGMEISQNVPVTVSYEDGKGSIKGTFDVDFAPLNAKGFLANPEKPEDAPVSSKVTFDLNVILK